VAGVETTSSSAEGRKAAMVYFDSSPTPITAPQASQSAQPSRSRARSRKSRASDQHSSSGASVDTNSPRAATSGIDMKPSPAQKPTRAEYRRLPSA
jgi:hypothetical protein